MYTYITPCLRYLEPLYNKSVAWVITHSTAYSNMLKDMAKVANVVEAVLKTDCKDREYNIAKNDYFSL
jgi:hypothetical protein